MVSIDVLPRDLLLRVLSFLCVPELCGLSTVSKHLRALAQDWTLWSSSYVQRWAPPFGCSLREDWKQLYRQRDAREIAELVSGADPDMKPYLLQMNQARRSIPQRTRNEFSIISDWQSRHASVDPSEHIHHDCSRDTCSYFVDRDLFICESSGRFHLCGAACADAVQLHNERVCRVSGRWSSQADSEDRRYPDDDNVDDPGDGSFLARCYAFGYNCKDEATVDQVFSHVGMY